MRTILIKNSTINSLLSISKFTNSLENINSEINNINLNPQTTNTTSEFIFNGSFNSNINILSTVALNLKEDFSSTLPIKVFNLNLTQINLLVFGNTKASLGNFNIECSENTSIGISLSQVDTPKNSKVNLSLISKNKLSTFNIIDFTPPIELTPNTIPLNLLTPKSGNVNIYKSIDSIDFINSYKINLTISTDVSINTVKDLSKYSLKTLTIWKDFLDSLTPLVSFKLPVTSILYTLPLNDGISAVNIDKAYLSSNILTASVSSSFSNDIFHITL